MQLTHRRMSNQMSKVIVDLESVLQSENCRGVRFQVRQNYQQAPQRGVRLTYRDISYPA